MADFVDEVLDLPCWWVDYCREGCPEQQCADDGCCAYPPVQLTHAPRLTWDESMCRPPRKPVETLDVGEVL